MNSKSYRLAQLFALASLVSIALPLVSQEPAKIKPEDTEIWQPVPAIVTPGATDFAPPSDAIVLFDGKNEDQWVSAQDHTPAQWVVHDGILTVSKAPGVGNIETKQRFKNYQLHIEFQIPANIAGSGQARGNNTTYVNGQGGSIYKESAPLVNPARKPGEWQSYDVVWTAPTFNADGSLKTPAYVTVLFNGVLVQNHFELTGQTLYIGHPFYKQYDAAPIKLQAHGDKSEPLSFRNIWVRELK